MANLLAKKLIDKYGSDRVYSYTFNALNTINIMDIPEGKRISNEKYRSIYNLYNDDNQTINLFNNESNFYMYGITKHGSIMNNATYRDKWRTATGIDYHVTTKMEYAKEFLNLLYDELNGIIVRSFFSSEQERTIENFINELKETNDPELFTNLCTDIIAYFFTLGPGMKDLDFYFEDPNDQKRYEDTRLMMEVIRNEKFSLSTHETGGLPELVGNMQGEQAVTYGKNQVRYNNISNFDEKLIRSIAGGAEFYINYVPTYEGNLETKVDKNQNIIYQENDKALNNLLSNIVPYDSINNTDTISYVNDNKIMQIITKDNNGRITEVFRNFNNPTNASNVQYDINSQKKRYMGHYKWKDLFNVNMATTIKEDKESEPVSLIEKSGYETTKDDCSGFVQLATNVREVKELLGGGLATKYLAEWNGSIADILYKNGYVCYYMNNETGNWWEARSTNVNELIENTEIIDKGVSFLEPGDLLVTLTYEKDENGNIVLDNNGQPKVKDGHAEFYVGDGYTVQYVNPNAETNIEKKKSGIASITIPSTFTAPNIKAVGTFSWGSVKDEFPVESSGEYGVKNYFYYNETDGYFQHCECGQSPTDEHSDSCSMKENGKYKKEYKTIWRHSE